MTSSERNLSRTTPAHTSGPDARRDESPTVRSSAKLSREFRPVPHLSPLRRWSPGGVGDEDLAVVHTSLGEDRLEVVLHGVG